MKIGISRFKLQINCICFYYTSSTIHRLSCDTFNRAYSNTNWFIPHIPKRSIQRGNFTAMWTRNQTRTVYLHCRHNVYRSVHFRYFVLCIALCCQRLLSLSTEIYLAVMCYNEESKWLLVEYIATSQMREANKTKLHPIWVLLNFWICKTPAGDARKTSTY